MNRRALDGAGARFYFRRFVVDKLLSPADCRRTLLAILDARRDAGGLYGAYRMSLRGRCDLYSSADAAILRTVVGEDLRTTLSPGERAEWIAHLHSFATPEGLFQDNHGCSFYHSIGTVVGALGVLGGRLPRPTPLFDELDTPDKIPRWLETRVDWTRTWPESHHFWGGMHVFSFSRRCTPGIWGLLTRLLPDEYPDDAAWSDIFSDRRFYLTHEVE